MALSDTDKQDIAQTVASALDDRRYIDEKTHVKHHEFMDTLILKQKNRNDMWQRIKEKGLTAVFLASLTVGGVAMWQYFLGKVH